MMQEGIDRCEELDLSTYYDLMKVNIFQYRRF